jgi:hypothetical protein
MDQLNTVWSFVISLITKEETLKFFRHIAGMYSIIAKYSQYKHFQ